MEVKQRTLLVSGDNDFGQLCTGNNKPTKKLVEPKLPPELVIQQVSVGYDHTLILTDTNELYVCGSNAYGKLGMGKHQEEINKLTRVDFSHLQRRPTLESPFTGSPMKFASTDFDESQSMPQALHHLTNIGNGTLKNKRRIASNNNSSSVFKMFQSNTNSNDAMSDLAEFKKRKNVLNGIGSNGSNGGTGNGEENSTDSFSTSAPITSETFLTQAAADSNTFSSPIGSSGSGSPFGESLEIRESALSISPQVSNHSSSSNTNTPNQVPFDASLYDSSHSKRKGHVKSSSIATSPLESESTSSTQVRPNFVKELISNDGDFRLSVSGESNEAVRIHQQDTDDINIVTTSPSPISASVGGTPSALLSPNSDQSATGSRRYSDAQPPTHVRYDSASLPTINTATVKATKHNTRDLGSFDFDNVVFSVGSDPGMTPVSEEDSNITSSTDEDKEKKRNSGGLKPFGSLLIRQRKSSNATVKEVPKLKTDSSDSRAQLDFLRDVQQTTTTPNTARNSGQIPPFEIKSIFCGRNNSFILTKDDEIYWCGERSSCYFKRLQDEELEGKKIKIFSTSPFADHFIIVTSQQEVLVSGNNSNGQLGDGTTLDCYGFLKKIEFDFGEDYTDEEKKYVDFKMAACGRAHTCIVATLNGGIDVFYSTGNNQFSQLGYALPVERAYFENPPSLPFERKPLKDLACGAQHTIVLTEGNEIWACGKGDLGQLGNGSYSPKNVFQKIDLPSNYIFRRVFCGGGYTVLLTTDNIVLRSGGNYYGQAFLGSTEMVCDYKEQKIEKIGSSYKVYSIHPTTLFCIIQCTKTVTTSRKSSRTVETPTQEKSATLKAGMFSSKSKLNLKLDLSGVQESDSSYRPNTTR